MELSPAQRLAELEKLEAQDPGGMSEKEQRLADLERQEAIGIDIEEDDEESTIGKITDFIVKNAQGAVAGVNQLLPLSDQLVGASATARQFLSGDLSWDDIPNQFAVNSKDALALKKKSIKEGPFGAGVGMGLAATAQAIATGGASTVLQGGMAIGQSAGIVGGESAAEGNSAAQVGTDAAYAGLAGAALSAAPEGYRQAKKFAGWSARKGLEKLGFSGSGLTQEETLGRKALEVMGAGKVQSTDLIEEAPGIAKTLKNQDIVQSGFEQKSMMWKRAGSKLKEVGGQIKQEYSRLKGRITNKEIRHRILNKARELNAQAPSINKPKVRALIKKAKLFKGKKDRDVMSIWNERKAIDDEIFKNSKMITKSGLGSKQKQTLLDTRSAVQDSINNQYVKQNGARNLEDLQHLNRDYSNLNTITKLVKGNQFTKQAGIFTRMTTGSAVATVHNPIVGGTLLTAKPTYSYFKPRMAFRNPSQSGLINTIKNAPKDSFVGPTVNAFNNLTKKPVMAKGYIYPNKK